MSFGLLLSKEISLVLTSYLLSLASSFFLQAENKREQRAGPRQMQAKIDSVFFMRLPFLLIS